MEIEPDRIERLECIGRGSYGNVYKGVDTQTGQQVAIKVIDLEDIEDDIEDIHKEISALAGCRSDHITRYYGSVMAPGSSELLILMELLACSVADLLAGSPLPEAAIAYVLHAVLAALDYLHGESRIHRDIKAANVLLSSSGEVKISDFGVSGQLTGTLGFRRRTFVGTPYWMAPEVIESSEEGYSTSADIWSVGITAIEMAQAAPPHAELHPMRVLFIIPKDPPPRLEGSFSDEFKDFVASCLQKDPTKRPSARELLAHPFVARATEAPPGLMQLVGEYAQRKRPVVPQRGPSPSEYSMGTLPTWDFGGNKAAATTGRHAAALGTLRSADPNLSSSGARDARTLTGGSASSMSGSFTGHVNTAGAGGSLSGAAGSFTGTARAGTAPGSGTGTVARADGWAVQQLASGSQPSSTEASVMASAAAPPSQEGPLPAEDQAGDTYSGTVRIVRGATSTLSALTAAVAGHGGSGGDGGGSGCGAGGSSSSSGGGNGSGGGTGSGAGDGPRAVYRRLPSLQGLSVDVGHIPGGGSAAGLPKGSGNAPEVTILRRFTRQESTAAAGEGEAALSRLLLPALRSLVPVAGGPEQAAVDAIVGQLQQLERQLPGSSARLLSEAMLQLSISDTPQLSKLLAAAKCIFGATGGASSGAGGSTTAAVATTPAVATPAAGVVRAGLAGAAAAAPASAPGGGPSAASRAGPDLGLLGNFLLARWREDAARSAAAAARTRAAW